MTSSSYAREDIDGLLRKSDLAFFAEDVLGMEISGHHAEWSRLTARHNRLGITASRDHGKCLAPETRILMSNGTCKPISDVREGEYILSEGQPYRISKVWSPGRKKVSKVTTVGGFTIRSTGEHRFWSFRDQRWKQLKDFEIGEECLVARDYEPGAYRQIKPIDSYSVAQIKSIEPDGEEEVLDIEVEGKHEFVAEGFKVHNSHFFSFAYALWRIYYAWVPPLPSSDFKSVPRNPSGYIFSSTSPNAIRMLDDIKSEIENNPKLSWLKPPNPNSWSKNEIHCTNNAIVRARGWGSSVRGGHPAWTVLDDVLDDESMYSELRRKKDVEYFYSAITPMVVPGGQIILVGTPMHATDLFASVAENEKYKSASFPAIKEDGTALWPTRYTLEMLQEKKEEVGSIRFSREYLVVPVSNESSLFPESLLRENYDPESSLITDMTPGLHNEYQIYTGVDLAMSASVGADYTVIMTIGVDQHKNRRIFDMRRFKGKGFRDQLREIEEVYWKYKPQKIFIEDNQMQRVFRDELVRYTDMPVEGFTTTSAKNSLERGVPSLQVLFENRKWIIPRKTERDRRITDVLINELSSFTFVNGKLQGLGAHDDTTMALWIANEASQSASFRFSFS